MRGAAGVTEAETDAHVLGEGLLVNKDGKVTVGILSPLGGLDEEEVGFSHEVYFDPLGEEALESFFFFGGFGEEYKVVDVEANIELFSWFSVRIRRW